MLWSFMASLLSSSPQNPPQLLKSVKIELNTCPLKDFHLVPNTSHCTPPLATPEHFGCFWIRNDWLGLLRPEYGFPEVSICRYRPWKRLNELFCFGYSRVILVVTTTMHVTSAGCVILCEIKRHSFHSLFCRLWDTCMLFLLLFF